MPTWLTALLLSPALAGDWATVPLHDGMDIRLEQKGIGVDQAGRPHIVFSGEDTVHHAMLDGQWSIEELVDPVDVDARAVHASLAVRNQLVVVVWSEGWDDQMWWAHGNWGDWTVDEANGFYSFNDAHDPVIAIANDGTRQLIDWEANASGHELLIAEWDPQGERWRQLQSYPLVHIDGQDPDLAFDSNSVAHYTWTNAGEFRYSVGALVQNDPPVEFVVAPDPGNHILGVDGSDRPMIATQAGDDVMLYRAYGQDWTSQVVDSIVGDNRTPGLVTDGAGVVHLMYIDDLSLEVVHATEQPTGGWAYEVAHHEFPGTLAMAARNQELYVAHARDRLLHYGHRDAAGTWTWEEVARGSFPGNGVSAASDATGTWVTHQDGQGDPLLPERLVLTWTDGTDVEHHELVPDGVYADTEVAIGSDGLLRIARVDGNGLTFDESLWASELVLMTGDPVNGWSETTVSRADDAPLRHALALDPTTDSPVVAYLTPNALGGAYHLVVARMGTYLFEHEVLSDVAESVDVVVADDDTVHVAWRDQTTASVMHSWDAGGTWTHEVVDDDTTTPLNGCGHEVAIDLDASGQAHLLYDCDLGWDEEARYALWVGDRWLKQVVAVGSATGVSLWMDDLGVAHGAVATAWPNAVWVGDNGSGAWNTEIIGAPEGSNDVDLAVSPDGELAVAWQDWERRDLNLSVAKADLEVTPESIDFGVVTLTESAEQTVTLTNTGTTDVALPAPVLAGPHPQAYAIVGSCTTLLPSESCTLTVRFLPDRVLHRVATLQVAPGHEVLLTGLGRGTFDTSGCTDGSCGSCGTSGGVPWLAWPIALLVALRRRTSTWATSPVELGQNPRRARTDRRSTLPLGSLFAVVFALLGAGCGPDLPEGWSDARPVDTLTQTECLDISPYEDHDERVEGDISASPLEVSLLEGHFRCEQDVEGFYKVDGGRVDVLVQPVDMNPKVVASCDCLYDIDMTLSLEVDLAPEEVTVYRRWDDINEPNDPVEIGSVVRE